MKRVYGALAVAGLLVILSQAGLAQDAARVSFHAPNFRAYTLEARPQLRTLAHYKGKVLILALWATWCRDCKDELASLQRVYSKYGSQGLSVVAVSVDRGSDEKIRDYARDLGLTFDILRDESSHILSDYLTPGVPTTFLIDRDGIIRRRVLSGIDWDVGPPFQQIEQLLSVSASTQDSATSRRWYH